MTLPCPSLPNHRLTISLSITKDRKLPPPNMPFDGLLETPTVQWMDLEESQSKYPAPATPPQPASPVPQSVDAWTLEGTVHKDLGPLLNYTDPWERALGSAIAGAHLLAMQALKTSPQEAQRILPLCQIPEEGTGPWDWTTMLKPPLAVDMLL